MSRWVIFDRDEASSWSRHVGYAPESGSQIRGALSPSVMGRCGLATSGPNPRSYSQVAPLSSLASSSLV